MMSLNTHNISSIDPNVYFCFILDTHNMNSIDFNLNFSH